MSYPKFDPSKETHCDVCGKVIARTVGRFREARRRKQGFVCGPKCAGHLGGAAKAVKFWN